MKKTNKLFYDRYVNKVSVSTPFANYFRSKNLDAVLSQVNLVAERIENNKTKVVLIGGWNKKQADVDDVFFMAKMLNLLLKETELSFRVEGSTLGIYTNNDSLIEEIKNLNYNKYIREISRPASDEFRDYLLKNPNKILSKGYSYKYKVTVNSLRNKEASENFVEWASKLDKIKITNRDFRYEGYFYVKDQKVLGLCRLYLGDRIRRIDELVTADEISSS